MIRISTVLLSMLFAGAPTLHAQGRAAAEKEARVLKGDDKGAAIDNPQCKLFSIAEAGHYIGAPVKSVENAGMGFGCQWAVGGGNGAMMVSVIPARYHEPPKLGKGFKNLPDLGVKGYAVPELGSGLHSRCQGYPSVFRWKGCQRVNSHRTFEKETMKRQSASVSK